MSNPQPQGAPAAQQQGGQLLKADDVPKLQSLTEDLKQKYRPIIQNLWSLMGAHPQGSLEYSSARAKLSDWSTKFITQEKQYRTRVKQQLQQQNQGQPAQQSAQQQQPPPMQQPSNPAQPSRPPQPNLQQSSVDPGVLKHVSTFKFYLPVNGPQPGTTEGDAKLKEYRDSYLMALNKQQRANQILKRLNTMSQQTGQENSPELANQIQLLEKDFEAAKVFTEDFRRKQAQFKIDQEQRRAQPQGQSQSQPQPQQQQHQQSTLANVKEEPQVKIEGGPMSQQFTGGATPSLPQQHNAQGPAPSLPQQQQQQQQPHQQPLRQPPVPHPQQNQPQFAQPVPPQAHQQPQRPPINPHQANSLPQVHQQNNSPHPQSATSTTAPAPLSHQAAVSAAQRSYSNQEAQRTNTPMQGGAQGNFHQGGRERAELNNPKMPIPRNLPPMPNNPVSMGQARPTMSGPTNGAPGPMGQPVISKFPPFQLEGENDRVLSKRKLDELVRQVTGGADDALTAEVEEVSFQRFSFPSNR
jgi:transcription initiation factor TFIID subunit 12